MRGKGDAIMTGYCYRILIVFLLMVLSFILAPAIHAQNTEEYDEISVLFTIQKVGRAEIPAVVLNETLFLPVADVFEILKIKNTVSPGMDSVTGFFINPGNLYLIDYPGRKIRFSEKEIKLPSDALIKTETNLYLNIDYFKSVFDLPCTFNFRALSVTLDTKLELPLIREMRLEQMRANITKLKGEVKADTTLGRTYPWFRLGMADWSVISSQMIKGRNDTRLNFALGAMVAGGEANVSLLFNNNRPFEEKQQQYIWRYANNDLKGVKQVIAGKIYTGATSSIYSPVIGVQVTNTPTTYRRSFGYYTLSDKTEPGWTVELYVNNVLIDFVKADASGFFTFQVPLVYGNSAVMLKYYGPWGEERTKEQNISIPFNFLPPGEMQYSASAGIVEDSLSSRFSRVSFNYGLNSRLTLGAGNEYLSSVKSGSVMPYINSSLRLASSLLISGEYTYGVRSRGILSYRFPSNLQFEVYYTKYDKDQKAINYNYLEERKAVVAVPIRSKIFSAFSRFTFNQIILPETKYTSAEVLLSGAILGASTNFTTYAMFIDPRHPYTYSNLSFSFRLPGAFVLIPQAQYEYTNNKFISLKCGIEKHISRSGYLNLSYEKNFRSNIQNIEFGFRYDFSFAQTAFTARRVNNNYQLTQSAKGSLLYNQATHDLKASSRTSVGKGGVVFKPFLDLNCNGRRDDDEPGILGLKVRFQGGRMELNKRDSSIWVYDLEPYTTYLAEFDKQSFDNIAWRIKFGNMRIAVDPNQFRLVEIPISVFGEASGMIYLKSHKGAKGLGRIIINFYDTSGKLAGRTLSESDGYFSFLGLPPGNYSVMVDTAQLKKIHMQVSPEAVPLTIEKSLDGDVRDDLEFILSSTMPDSRTTSDKGTAGSSDDAPGDAVINANPPGTSVRVTVKGAEPSASDEEVLVPNQARGSGKEEIRKEESLISPEMSVIQADKPTPAKAKPAIQPFSEPETEPEDPIISAATINDQAEESYVIQAGAFVKSEYAVIYRNRLVDALSKKVIIIEDRGFFRVLVVGFTDAREARNFLPVVRKRGFDQAYVTKARL